MHLRITLTLLFTCLCSLVDAQTQDVWTLARIIKNMRTFHPVIKQAGIQIDIADAERLVARGAFDPVLDFNSGAKTLNNTNYYNYANPQITVPTWIGLNAEAGVEYLGGSNPNPTETFGRSSYLGFSMPLAQGLLMDKRRATLLKAKAYYDMSVVEQNAVVNNILMDGIEAYWQWVRSYEVYNIVLKNVEVTTEIFDLVKRGYANGERPAIDTTEILAQLQSLQTLLQSELLYLQQARVNMSYYLWNENEQALNLNDNAVPNNKWEQEVKDSELSQNLDTWLNKAMTVHPELLVYINKLEALDIEKRYRKQNLLPKVDFRYNQLGKDYNLARTLVTGPLFTNNYNYGLKFNMPLRLREAKGEYRIAQKNIELTNYQRLQKQNTISNKVRYYYIEYTGLQRQIEMQEKAYLNYNRLVLAEEQKFFNGESSIFLVNSRINKALEAQQKLIELKTKLGKVHYSLLWAAGMLPSFN